MQAGESTDNLGTREAGKATSGGTGTHGASAQPGFVGAALAAVLTFALAQGFAMTPLPTAWRPRQPCG
ncbi:hypothetical protein SAV31267_081240 [Streptomyces avermitilis]|nr:hypothetical protein SAV31267_081240 [Streptomyces avermitilis]